MRVRGFSTGLYGWMERFARDGEEWDWHRLYRACAESGVDAVETDPTPEKLAVLRSYGLAVSASYIGLPLHLPFDELDVDRSVLPIATRLAEAGGTDLLLNADLVDWTTSFAKTDADAAIQGENLSRIANRTSGLGLRLSLHNHAADFGNAQADLDSVVRHSDPSVGLCVDTGWAHVAGHDPVRWVRDYPDRIRYFHLRNQRGTVPGEDLADGEISIPELLAAASAANYAGWLTLELWHPETLQPERSMLEDTRRSIEYLRGLLEG